MEENKIKVYIKIDSNNCITYINSSIFLKDIKDWICIDEGFGQKYAHAQNYYFEDKKPLRDNEGRCNYKLVDNKPLELTEEEKEKLFPPIPIQPSPQEEFENKIILENINMQLQIDSLIESNLGGM